MKTVIIGGSATGMGVAARLKRNNPKDEVLVIQAKDYVSLGACGLPYFVSNNFDDKDMLIARKVEAFQETGIEIMTNSIVDKIDFDHKEVFVKDKKVTYDKLVIAVGAKPIVPNLPGITSENVFTLTTLEDGVLVKEKMNKDSSIKKVAIIGAGFIGLEMCEALHTIKKEIYLVEMEKRISAKVFDIEFSDLINEDLLTHKVNVMLEKQVVEIIATNNKVSGIKLSDGTIIRVDAVVMAVGFIPNTNFLKKTKLDITPRGAIVVNTKGETNIKDVYSAGDCALSKNIITNEDIYSPLATVASKFARVIADNISGKNIEFVGSIQSAMLRLFESDYARTGLTEVEASMKNINFKTVFIKDKDHTHYVPDQSDLYLKLIVDIDKNIIIGAQMKGKNNSVLRINAIATMIWLKADINLALEQIDLPYAPPYTKTTDILHIALSKIKK